MKYREVFWIWILWYLPWLSKKWSPKQKSFFSSYARAIFDIQVTKNRIAKTRCINFCDKRKWKPNSKDTLSGFHALPDYPIAKTRCMGSVHCQLTSLTRRRRGQLRTAVRRRARTRGAAASRTDGTSPWTVCPTCLVPGERRRDGNSYGETNRSLRQAEKKTFQTHNSCANLQKKIPY